MTTKAERIREARTAHEAAKAALVLYDAKTKATNEARTKAAGELARLEKRSPAVVIEAQNDWHAQRLASLGVGWGAPDTEKDTLAFLTRDKDPLRLSLGTNSSISYSLKGMAQRTRVISPEHVRAVERARKREAAALEAYRKAMAEHKSARHAAFDAGTKVTPELVAKAVAKAHAVRRLSRKGERMWASNVDYDRARLVETVDRAAIHLEAQRTGADCSCTPCRQARSEAAIRKAEAERRSALPKRKVTCPTHGPKLAPWERRSEWWENRHYDGLPIAYCPAGCRLVVKAQLDADEKVRARERKAQERERAKAERAATKARRTKNQAGVGEGSHIDFDCPNCGETLVDSIVLADEDDGTLFVECLGCEMSLQLDELEEWHLTEGRAA